MSFSNFIRRRSSRISCTCPFRRNLCLNNSKPIHTQTVRFSSSSCLDPNEGIITREGFGRSYTQSCDCGWITVDRGSTSRLSADCGLRKLRGFLTCGLHLRKFFSLAYSPDLSTTPPP
ncbi:unnamed protein product [Meloidogyne enterolobii]|uniref:Uncharacterized protein n=1 Tax=Meloidogyne enterolobii TaxID=390850 RepID=A0ACB0Y3V1_MELEN